MSHCSDLITITYYENKKYTMELYVLKVWKIMEDYFASIS